MKRSKFFPMLLKQSAGFTLIEVAIAMAILAGASIALIGAQSQSVNNSAKAKQFNLVAMLLQQKMDESQLAVRGKAFSEIDKETSGQFPAPFEDFNWKREIKEVEFPNISGAPEGSGAAAGGGNAAGGSGDQSADMVGKLVTKYLSKAVRELSVTISWKRGKGQLEQTATTYWVDLNTEFALSE